MKEALMLEECFARGWQYVVLKKTEHGHIVELEKDGYKYISNLRKNGDVEFLLNMAEISLAEAVCYQKFKEIDALIDASANVVRLKR